MLWTLLLFFAVGAAVGLALGYAAKPVGADPLLGPALRALEACERDLRVARSEAEYWRARCVHPARPHVVHVDRTEP
jgi:hypothetical protein